MRSRNSGACSRYANAWLSNTHATSLAKAPAETETNKRAPHGGKRKFLTNTPYANRRVLDNTSGESSSSRASSSSSESEEEARVSPRAFPASTRRRNSPFSFTPPDAPREEGGVSTGLAATSTVSCGLIGATSESSASAAPRSTSLHRDGGRIFAARAHASRSSPTRQLSGTSNSADHPCLSVRTVSRIGGPPRAVRGKRARGRVNLGPRRASDPTRAAVRPEQRGRVLRRATSMAGHHTRVIQ